MFLQIKNMHNRLFAQYRRCVNGNIAINFAIAVPILLILIGGAVDFANAFSNKSKFQNISDAAALAGAKGKTEAEMKAIAQEYIKYYQEDKTDRFTVTKFEIYPEIDRQGRRTVKVDLFGKPKTYFLHLMGMDEIPLTVSSTVTEADKPIEIALVLDISWSMRGAKMANLRLAADDFIDTIIEGENSTTTTMSIVPFGGNVNIGASLASRFMPSPATAITDPDDRIYRQSTNNPTTAANSRFRFSDGMNCVETILDDYDTELIPDNSRSQLPRFMNRQSMITICPEDENSILFNSNNNSELKTKMTQISMSHGTGMDVGALWGLKALSPSHRGIIGGAFTSRPADFGGRNEKILVIMSDGNITGQGRPRQPNDPRRLTDPNRMNNKPLYSAGNPNSDSSDDDASGRFRKVCEAAAANNIKVYTIGYQISVGGSADRLLGECASSSGNYFFVESTDIGTAFQSIANKISELRIVK